MQIRYKIDDNTTLQNNTIMIDFDELCDKLFTAVYDLSSFSLRFS